MDAAPRQFYQVGGSLPPQATSYARRQADADFYDALAAGQYCYVLNSRQMGKSSLRVRTMQRLQSGGVTCIYIDLQGIGKQNVTPQKWYAGLIKELVNQAGVAIDWRQWWRSHQELLSPVQCLRAFVDEVLLVEIPSKIVIFIDEIDAMLSQDFAPDNFFALIRFFYNSRVDDPKYSRLTFALLGVATPSDLVADKTQTPFNIGRAIALEGFTLSEALPLAQGLANRADDPQAALGDILTWTGGQPFLTQKVCQLAAQAAPQASIAQLVRDRVITNWESQDEPEHLRTIHDRLHRSEARLGALLGLYQSVLQQGGIAIDNSPEQAELLLSGLVVKRLGQLRVANPIYQSVFGPQWVTKGLQRIRPYREAIAAWLASERQDASRLLQGQALQGALVWKAGKRLSAEDEDFLTASQSYDKRLVQQQLQAEQQAKQVLAEANQQAKRRIRWGVGVGAALLAALVGTGGVLWLGAQSRLAIAQRRLDQTEEQLGASQRQVDAAQQQLDTAQQDLSLTEKERQDAQRALRNAQQKLTVTERARSQAQAGLAQAQAQVAQAQQALEQERFSLGRVSQLLDSAKQSLTQTQRDRDESQVVIRGLDARRLLTSDPFGALLAALDAADHLQTLTPSPVPASDPHQQIHSALQQAVRQVHEVNRLMGHSGRVRDVTFSPDGTLLASAGEDGTIRLWTPSGALLKTFEGHKDNLWAVRFSPDGQTLASASDDGTIKLWGLEAGHLRTLQAHQTAVRGLAFSPDGTRLVSSSSAGNLRLWTVADGALVGTLPAHPRRWATYVTFSPDGRTLASTSQDRTIKLWRAEDRCFQRFEEDDCLVETLAGHQNMVRSASFSADGQFLASAGADSNILLWNLETGDQHVLRGHRAVVWRVSFLPEDAAPSPAVSNGVSGSNGAELTPSGQLASASEDGTLKLWNLAQLQSEPQTFAGHQGRVWSVAVSPDGKTLASSGNDETVRLWRSEGMAPSTLNAHSGQAVQSTQFSPNGQLFASAGGDGTVKLWRASDRALVQTLLGHHKGVQRVGFSPDGTLLAAAGVEHLPAERKQYTVKVWRVADGHLVTTLRGHPGAVRAVSFSPNGEFLATAGDRNAVKLWQIDAEGQSFQELQTFTDHSDDVRDVAFSPDSKLLASVGDDRTVMLWDVAGRKRWKTLRGHTSYLASVTFSPNGQLVASGGGDATIRLWSAQSGELVQSLEGHGTWIRGLDFSPDGQMLASASFDRTVKVWQMGDPRREAEGELLTTLDGHLGKVEDVSFDPTGTALASSSRDGTLRLWQLSLDLDALTELGCSWLQDYLNTRPEEGAVESFCQAQRF